MKRPRREVWQEARELLWSYRRSLSIGFALMIVNRLAGFVLPASTKFLIDNVFGQGQTSLLLPLALAVGAATIIQAVTTFSLSQVVSVAAQGAIMDMRRRVQERVTRLPIRFFDGTQSGVLISRIMTDAEGIRNLIGTGIIQLVGGVLTAILALGVLFYLNWQLTAVILVFLLLFGGAMALAFSRLRPIFRERGQLNAEVTGRLAETLGGIRVVKAYRMEEREQRVFSEGVARLFANVKRSITGTSAYHHFCHGDHRRGRGPNDPLRRAGHPGRHHDPGRPGHVRRLRRDLGRTCHPDCVYRHPGERGVRRARPYPRAHGDDHRRR
jgi:subfamily B ATP-binding cassette protein MsbA